MIKSPRRDYEVRSLDTEAKVAFRLPALENGIPLEMTLTEALLKRRTSWNFSGKDLDRTSLAQLLTNSFGVSQTTERKRTYPSGGQFYPVEIYFVPGMRLIKKNVLEEKVYKYNVDANEVVEISTFNYQNLHKFSPSTDIGLFSLEGCQLALFFVAEDRDLYVKYLEYSYRILLLDAGHMAQNFMLASTALGISSVPAGGFYEGAVKELLGLENSTKMVIYTLLAG